MEGESLRQRVRLEGEAACKRWRSSRPPSTFLCLITEGKRVRVTRLAR